MGTILIKNGRIFDGNAFYFKDIFIVDNLLEAIAPALDCNASFSFDAAGMTVLPGLVDIHMHMAGISGPRWSAYPDGCCFPFGVTAAADAGAELGSQETLQAFGIKSVVYVLADVKRPIDLQKLEENLARYGDKAVGIKLCYDRNCNAELSDTTILEKVCNFAHDRGLNVTVHTSNCPIPMSDLLSVLDKGDIATHIYHSTGHTVAEDRFQCLFDAKKRGVILDAGLAANGHVDFTIFKDAINAGVAPDVISTDLVRQMVFTKGGRYGLTMCMSIAQHLGMHENDIFSAVTSRAANALRQPWGILQEGCSADIAVLEYGNEPFDLTDKSGCRIHSDYGYRCHLTISDGNVVYKA